ncbi:MAG: DUF1553 domain-containing protein, partial [Bryobacteraceae bacterium]
RNAFFHYLRDAVYHEKSFKDIAWELITGSGNNFDVTTGAVNFVIGSSTTMGPQQDTYDTMLAKSASTFLGLSYYDCILCHNGRGHLDQLSLWGSQATRLEALRMAAFFSRQRLNVRPNNPQTCPATESCAGQFYFQSTLVNDAAAGAYDLNTNFGNRPNRIPIGNLRSLTPEYRLGGAPAATESWREAFANSLAADPMFARNIVNRLWKQLFNLGLVEPVDALDPARLDPASPPPAPWNLQATHPELLEKLAVELVAMNYQLRPFLRRLVESSAYQLSSRYEGDWKPEYVPLFARHYARRLEGEEIHDAIAQATGVAGSYMVFGWADPVEWAIQLPEPVEPRGNGAVNNFMNAFLRGNRDNQTRAQYGSIQQQLALMNDAFVNNRVRVTASPRLRAIAQLTSNEEILNEIYTSFLSRLPTENERGRALSFLSRSTTPAARNTAVEDLAWAAINKVEFLFSY